MNLVGKIFTALIFVMCIVFATFALMVHAAHKNWRDEIVKANGYRQQIDDANKKIYEQKQAYNLLVGERKADKDRSDDQIRKLQAENKLATDRKLAADTTILQLESDLRKHAATDKVVAQNNTVLRDENDSLRGSIKVAETERQTLFDNLVKATTDVTNSGAEIARLQKLGRDVAAQAAQYHGLLQKAKISESNIENDPPAGLSGLVNSVRQSDVEITLGSDDGVRPGHRFSVTRPSTGQYVGDIQVIHVDYPNRAVARAVKETMRDQIQKYDHVQASLKNRR